MPAGATERSTTTISPSAAMLPGSTASVRTALTTAYSNGKHVRFRIVAGEDRRDFRPGVGDPRQGFSLPRVSMPTGRQRYFFTVFVGFFEQPWWWPTAWSRSSCASCANGWTLAVERDPWIGRMFGSSGNNSPQSMLLPSIQLFSVYGEKPALASYVPSTVPVHSIKSTA